MEILYCILGLVLCFFFPNVLYLTLGIIFYRFRRTHKFGIRCLAMCMLVSSAFVAKRCRQDCSRVKCGNWTCSQYNVAGDQS